MNAPLQTRRRTLRSARDLAEAGLVEAARLPALEAVAARYAVAVTPAMADLVAAEGGTGPITRQFAPDPAELSTTAEENADPVGDFAHSPVEGVVHRYPDRVLLKPTHTCAVYCRFCFRREMVGPDGHGNLTAAQLDAAFDYIAGRPEIWEVILTGGDPLVMSPRRLEDLMRRLAAVEHVKVVRVHTRVPAVAPERITDAMVEALKASGKALFVALHANHADELTPAARAACAKLVDAGVPMISQTVLLAGVNDDPQTLGSLMRAFVETRIKPYYLHHGDLAPGTGHMRTTVERGQDILRTLRGRWSGLCQPAYVLDIPGGHGKAPVDPCYVQGGEVEDFNGVRHAYPPRSGG
jgi:lysine 2,3-aminomutase